MLTQLIWWGGHALEGLLLFRALKGRFLTKYPLFYFYLSFVLLQSLLRFYFYVVKPQAYAIFYWYTEFFLVGLSYGIIWEIYTKSLENYPGAARLVRLLLSAVYVLLLARVVASGLSGSLLSLVNTTAVLERNLHTVQAFLLLGILGLLAYYDIPLGRNLKGMLGGYGFFVGITVVNLTLRSYLGKEFYWWRHVQPMAFFATLLVWCTALWSYQPNPPAEAETELERDYQTLAAATGKAITRIRQHVLRIIRS